MRELLLDSEQYRFAWNSHQIYSIWDISATITKFMKLQEQLRGMCWKKDVEAKHRIDQVKPSAWEYSAPESLDQSACRLDNEQGPGENLFSCVNYKKKKKNQHLQLPHHVIAHIFLLDWSEMLVFSPSLAADLEEDNGHKDMLCTTHMGAACMVCTVVSISPLSNFCKDPAQGRDVKVQLITMIVILFAVTPYIMFEHIF